LNVNERQFGVLNDLKLTAYVHLRADDVGNLSRTGHIVDEMRQRNFVKGNWVVLFSW